MTTLIIGIALAALAILGIFAYLGHRQRQREEERRKEREREERDRAYEQQARDRINRYIALNANYGRRFDPTAAQSLSSSDNGFMAAVIMSGMANASGNGGSYPSYSGGGGSFDGGGASASWDSGSSSSSCSSSDSSSSSSSSSDSGSSSCSTD